MDAEGVMERRAAEAGWSVETQLALALEYINNQGDNPALDDFLARKAEEEREASGD